MQRIENDFLIVEINENGAELMSIKSKKTGTEYLWQGNPDYWKGRSPILFPICGRLFDGKYLYKGKEYEMPIHGIAKLFEFSTVSNNADKISLKLKSNENTKVHYPFDFEFFVNYTLKEKTLITEFNVINTGENDMYFSFGGHPGFNVPFSSDDSFEDYFLDFNKDCLEQIVLSDSGLYLNRTQPRKLNDGKLFLEHSLFDDSLFFAMTNGAVSLKSIKSNKAIEVSFTDMTCLGFWQKSKSDAPYVCIEPWRGVPSDEGRVDDFETKRQMKRLGNNESYLNAYTIKIIE